MKVVGTSMTAVTSPPLSFITAFALKKSLTPSGENALWKVLALLLARAFYQGIIREFMDEDEIKKFLQEVDLIMTILLFVTSGFVTWGFYFWDKIRH